MIEKIVRFSEEKGLQVEGLTFSPVRGPEGNIEYLICVSKKEDLIPFEDDKIKEVVKVAHEVLDK